MTIAQHIFSNLVSGTSRFAASALVLALAATPFAVQAQEPAVLQAAADALGASTLKSIEFTGQGHWYQFGQAANPKGAWPQFDVSSYKATINYEQPAAHVQLTRKQTIEPNRQRPAPVEQKPDQYVSGSVAWNLAPPAGAAADAAPVAQPQPTAVEERQAEIWTTPQGFIKAALSSNATTKHVKNGTEVSFAVGNHRYVGTLNAKHELTQVKTWIDNPVLGDTLVDVRYSGYKNFNGVAFPTTILRKQGGHPVLALGIDSVTPNAQADIAVPADIAKAEAPKVSVTSEQLAPGVFYLKGGTHHSVVIEQKDHVVVVEAPLNEARSEAVIAKVHELVPNKPIRYVVNTHQHFDHSGGLRTYVAEGATIVTHKLNVPYYQQAWTAPRSLNPDRLAQHKQAAKFLTFGDKRVLTDGQRQIEIHQIAGSGHNDAFALVYLPAEKILVEADAYTPAAADAPPPASVNPYSVNLYDNIKRLKLDVQQIAALHGPRITTVADLETAIGKQNSASN